MVSRFLFNFRNPSLIGNSISLLKSFHMSSALVSRNNVNLNGSSVAIENNVVSYDYNNLLKRVDNCLAAADKSRLFAVVHLCGKQYKITSGDIVIVEGYWPPTIGDQIRLEKVLLVGGVDFTLVGTPVLKSGMVNIEATIIEKTLMHTKTHFKKKRRKQYIRVNFQRSPNTMIRINSIEVAKGMKDSRFASSALTTAF